MDFDEEYETHEVVLYNESNSQHIPMSEEGTHATEQGIGVVCDDDVHPKFSLLQTRQKER